MKGMVVLLGLVTASLLSGKGVDRQEGDTHTVAGTRSDCGGQACKQLIKTLGSKRPAVD